MARKVTFDIADDETDQDRSPTSSSRSQSRAPSLSGMAKSLQDAASSSIQDISTDLIDESEFRDRFDIQDDPEIHDLAESIRKQGQLIPILVSPTSRGRYRVIYGRRRLAALRTIGLPAKALVRSLDEDQSIIAQGQENSFRKDLSWIEKAVFAKHLLDAGKSEGLICDALNIDQKARRSREKLTGLNRMKQVASRIPKPIIDAIGPAPGVGRDRWYAVTKALERFRFPAGNQDDLDNGSNESPTGNPIDDMLEVLEPARECGWSSDRRFDALEAFLRRHKSPALSGSGSSDLETALGTVRISRRSAVISVKRGDPNGLHEWISRNPDLALEALVDAKNKDSLSENDRDVETDTRN